MIGNDWDEILKDEYDKPYFKKLITFVNDAYDDSICYPLKENIFKAFRLTPFKNIKVVILGQDPYHGENEANGLCFSVSHGVKCPPSLMNIFKELYADLGIKRTNTELDDWAMQGVLLLNSLLTVEKDKPLSHKDNGWEIFTDEVIRLISLNNPDVVFVLWGNYARSKKNLISKNPIIESAHPSPLSASRGFLGSKPFSQVNQILESKGKSIIKW